MNATPYICAYYSEGPGYLTRLKSLRARFPHGRICAMVPLGQALSDEERAETDDVVETSQAHYSPRELRACLSLLRMIRRRRFDLFMVMFDSIQLNLLAALSGARRRECWTQDHCIVRLPRSVPGVLWRVLLGHLRGRLVFLPIWLMLWWTTRPDDDLRKSGRGARRGL